MFSSLRVLTKSILNLSIYNMVIKLNTHKNNCVLNYWIPIIILYVCVVSQWPPLPRLISKKKNKKLYV